MNLDARVLEEMEALTQQGLKSKVMHLIRSVTWSLLTEEQSTAMAKFANRNHNPIMAMRILHPYLKKHRDLESKINDETILVYSSALLNIGAIEEAKQYLSSIRSYAPSALTHAFMYFAEWNYAKAIPYLEKYMRQPHLPIYQRYVGQINLLAAYVALFLWQKGMDLALELEAHLSEHEQYRILYANLLELQAQLYWQQGALVLAEEKLRLSQALLASQHGRYQLYVNKWLAVIQLQRSPESLQSLNELSLIRDQAIQLRNWETVRDCDLHLGALTNDRLLLERVYWGTPYPNYRQRISKLYGFLPSKDHAFCFNPADQRINVEKVIFDLQTFPFRKSTDAKVLDLLYILTRDIYRSPRMGVVFAHLYPGEYFDPYHSPHRVRSRLHRINVLLQENRLPLAIKINRGDFQLVTESSYGIRVVSSHSKRIPKPWQWQLLRKEFKGQLLTSVQVAKALKISQRSANRLIRDWINKRLLRRVGRGRDSRYGFFVAQR